MLTFSDIWNIVLKSNIYIWFRCNQNKEYPYKILEIRSSTALILLYIALATQVTSNPVTLQTDLPLIKSLSRKGWTPRNRNFESRRQLLAMQLISSEFTPTRRFTSVRAQCYTVSPFILPHLDTKLFFDPRERRSIPFSIYPSSIGDRCESPDPLYIKRETSVQSSQRSFNVEVS